MNRLLFIKTSFNLIYFYFFSNLRVRKKNYPSLTELLTSHTTKCFEISARTARRFICCLETCDNLWAVIVRGFFIFIFYFKYITFKYVNETLIRVIYVVENRHVYNFFEHSYSKHLYRRDAGLWSSVPIFFFINW